jgi:AcrR family transcriptional regulator
MSGVLKERKRQKPPKVRLGRPPRQLAGEVDDRILEAAHRVFMEHGLGGASIDEIARLARAGKPTIYARFPAKEALFEAVIARNAAKVRANFETFEPAGATIEERLVNLGTEVLERLLSSEVIDFMRLASAEARRYPKLANVGRMARERGAQAVAQVLSEMARAGELRTYPGFAPERLDVTTQFFTDLVIERLLRRALVGESLRQLHTEIKTHVPRGVAFFLAACRNQAPKMAKHG